MTHTRNNSNFYADSVSSGQEDSRGKTVRVASDEAILRNRLIRLAASRPDLREHILPLVSDLRASHIPLGKAAATTLPATVNIDPLLEKVRTMMELLVGLRLSMPPRYRRIPEIENVSDALVVLGKVFTSHPPLPGKAAATTLPATVNIDPLLEKVRMMMELLVELRLSMPPRYRRIPEIEDVSDALVVLGKVFTKGGQ